ncbi:class I SAM-dependent methyltransferase [Deinococcus hopiensis]|uniref:Methyltransferase domain-containing protein n=1 Tax=Deinococcus hopiensis KR-140 TaxID=695939 RepID=A0A1W1UYH2_9DEIO|nr:class I SAM-dependent methyltransferase [Deinococcus hopiensis]SMB86126.1 Methyltransferase domain-containing protein [Deinococcus hopiensis KR-140]
MSSREAQPHSREWYARLAKELGGYRHPWQRSLDGPDPELVFDALLLEYLTPDTRVLEAGCGHGPDATRFAPQCARWVGYDRQPELLELAQRNAPQAEFYLWDGKGPAPSEMQGPFDLIVSRRGPTSVIHHLSKVAAPSGRFLYVGPRLEVPNVPASLHRVGWTIAGEWRVSIQAYAPTLEDWRLRCEFMGEETRQDDWQHHATGRGMPYREERYVVLAKLGNYDE